MEKVIQSSPSKSETEYPIKVSAKKDESHLPARRPDGGVCGRPPHTHRGGERRDAVRRRKTTLEIRETHIECTAHRALMDVNRGDGRNNRREK